MSDQHSKAAESYSHQPERRADFVAGWHSAVRHMTAAQLQNTAKKTYFCNFCRSEFSSDIAATELIGVMWHTGSGGDSMQKTPVSEAKTHICKECLHGLGDIRDRLTNAEGSTKAQP